MQNKMGGRKIYYILNIFKKKKTHTPFLHSSTSPTSTTSQNQKQNGKK
jgi:hypothetical protein